MNDRVLQSLMQLFGVIANIDGISVRERDIVLSFLKQDVHSADVEKYISIFDQYVEHQHHALDKKDGVAKRTSLNSVKIFKICIDINKDLDQSQKVVLLIRLLEFAFSSQDIISEQEYEFIAIVVDALNIPSEEFKLLKSFVESAIEKIRDTENLLLISNKTESSSRLKHMTYTDLMDDVKISTVKIPSVGMYAFKIIGNQELILNGKSISSGPIHVLIKGSSLRYGTSKPIYYHEIIRAFSNF